MGTLTDYLDWRGDLRFSEIPLGEVDGLILSLIAYMPFEEIVPSPENEGSITLLEAMRAYTRINKGKKISLGRFISPELISMTVRAAKSRRFGGIRLSHYVNEVDEEAQKQFSAVTYRVTRDKYFVAYRGTDDTLAGWKESFNMSFMRPIPGQTAAVEYLQRSAGAHDGHFYVGGHSKGGNLAVYAAGESFSELGEKLLTVYNYDGPGFDAEYLEGEQYRKIKERVRTFVPQSSVVGMLLEHEEDYEVIKSRANGLTQHTGHSWEVLGNGFVHLDTVTEDSKLIDEKLKEWLYGMTVEEREAFADTIFETVSATNAKTLTELTSDRIKLVKAWNSLDQKTKSVLLKCVAILIKHNAISIK